MNVVELITKLHSMPPKADVLIDTIDDSDEILKLCDIGEVVEAEIPGGGIVVAIMAKIQNPDYINN